MNVLFVGRKYIGKLSVANFLEQIIKKNPLFNVVVDSPTTICFVSDYVCPSQTASQIFDIVEQLQTILAIQPCNMHASSTKGLNSSCLSCMCPSIWIIDFGTTHHMSYDDKLFVYLNHFSSMSV